VIHRVLIVDDYEPWRRHVTSTLQASPQWKVVGEAADGPEAIEKALTLHPDLILIDIGLPTLNGIEATRRILAHDASSRILFVSEHHSVDIVEAALCAGGRGYVCKSDSGRELSHAMDAVVDGRRFIGVRLGGRALANTSNESVRRHEVAFYTDQTALVEEWAQLANAAFDRGDGFIVVATSPSREKLRELLRRRGVDVDRAGRDGRYHALDVSDVLSGFLVDGWPDEARFWKATLPLLIATAHAAPRRRIVACGELAPSLCSKGMMAAAIRVEQLWDEAGRMFDLDVFCGYLSNVPSLQSEDDELFQQLCTMHTAVHSR